ncbi:tannase and feruloyl esterase [Hypoxylon rubiginosum]|uniref:Tannase and feruloyl esterase n=1 Tax=Hypoxylon rubiginosum TaxID=110542 RepID=A0ACC0CUC8_9PEZI|nr:tannase and feruloyl esterase [Hypoxylon rubiginosum]
MQWPSAIPLAILGGAAVTAAECTVDAFTEILKEHSEATINLVEAVPANGSFGQPETDIPFPYNATSLPPLCAVSINVKSSENSSYNFGLFLPDTTWNERFMTTGNGGFGGGINWPDMGILSQYGFATMSTDTGHSSSAVDGSWGLNSESLIDWAHRAMHGSIVLAKEVVGSYYATSDGIKYSYYAGCSTGGRQGLKEIQLYPDSFDGISVGAPAWWTVHLAANTLQQGLYNVPESDPKHIDPSLFPAIVAEMEKQCDPQDGLVDGIVSDPYGCNFNFEALLCTPTSDAGTCLTPAQLTTIYKFYNPWIDANQTYLFPGISIGTDPSYALGSVSPLGYGLFQYWVYNNSEWDYTKFSLSDVQFADSINPGGATADNFDLSPFMERGGKILKYHGDADSLIPTGSSIYFYKQVLQTLVPKGIDVSDFYRFFLIPGMNHCSGSTVAPWYIASASQSVSGATHSVPGFENAEYDIIMAMMKWVEGGEAPEQLIATKFINDTATLGIQSQRPLCPFPEQAKYITGDPNEADSWECKSLY